MEFPERKNILNYFFILNVMFMFVEQMQDMKLQKTWFEKLFELDAEACIPLKDTPSATVYSAIHSNRDSLGDRRFRIQTDYKTKKKFVCRVK